MLFTNVSCVDIYIYVIYTKCEYVRGRKDRRSDDILDSLSEVIRRVSDGGEWNSVECRIH